ncbi:nucleolar protein 9-like protein [Dinothrombium tinctorium]|uniref:Nucleolar protein 9-like protein n=1 Tax=Dinothrombium tinctorium TaxID=1965070 RepID=A0A443RP04_9ACAR|nr:nucleolar protein 9-like protein [Dinothrombium tinctorium]
MSGRKREKENSRRSLSRSRDRNARPSSGQPAHRRRSRSSSSSSSRKRSTYDQEYFSRMSKRIHDGFRDDIDKEVFAENISKQIKGKEIALAIHKHPSICIQWLIENASDASTIKQLTERLKMSDISVDFMTNQYASHVMQALIEASLKILSRESTTSPSNHKHSKWANAYICSIGEFVIANMDKLLSDVNGSHVMITIMEAMGGIRVGRHWSRKTMGFGMKSNINTEIEKDIVVKELPTNFKSLLKKFSKELIIQRGDRDLKDIILGRGTSLIQYLLFVLKVRSADICQSVVKRLVDIIFVNEENKFAITTNSVSAYLVEAIMLVSNEHRLNRIWEKHLKGSLKEMWKDDIANFIVQRLVDAASSESLFADICSEMLPHLESIFSYNRPGIGVCLAKACQKFSSLQQDFIQALMKAFHCYEPKDRQIHLVPLMLFGEKTGYPKNEIWLHGSLMLQYIFGYEDPYKVTKSLLSLEPKELVFICNDKSGSHVIDSFLQSQTVAQKHKHQFLEKMRGSYIHLACDRFGSRIIDYLLNTVEIKMKADIMDELSAKESQLNSTKNGYYVGKKAGVYHYKYRQTEWKEVERAKDKRKRAFKDIIMEEEDRFVDKRYQKTKRY